MTNKTLSVMEIERFAIHDGQGIRSVVFLQGCPLHCAWCANPESQQIGKHLLHAKSKCVQCRACEKVCQQHAIHFENDVFQYDERKCIACEQCCDVCLQDAIAFSGKVMSIDAIMKEIKKDDDYYEQSNGGVTISGGEAYVQYDGFLVLLKRLKERGYHVCVETCGQVANEKIIETLPYIDTFLFDIKHIDAQKLDEGTGGTLSLILKNLECITSYDPKKVIIRVPVIPSFNYDETTLTRIIKLALHLHITEVHLLPYHTLGKNKYEQLGKVYTMANVSMIDKLDLLPYIEIGKTYGVHVKIGG